MHYRLSNHARKRMRERKINEDDIERVLSNPSMSWHDPSEYSMVLTGVAADGETLLVYVYGEVWPVNGTIQIKSTTWRDK